MLSERIDDFNAAIENKHTLFMEFKGKIKQQVDKSINSVIDKCNRQLQKLDK